MKVLLRSIKNFIKDNGFSAASSLSFFFILSLAPFLLILSAIFSFLLTNYAQYYNVVSQKLIIIFPPIFKGIVFEIINPLVYKKISYFSLVIYLITTLSYLYTLDKYINKIFKIDKKRSIFGLIFLYIMLIGITILFIIVYIAGFFIPIETISRILVNTLHITKVLDLFGIYIMPFLALFIISFAFYKILPRRKVANKSVFIGALFFAIIVEISKRLFAFYVISIGKLGILYGAFWGYIAFLSWVYIFFCVLLIGAWIVATLEDLH